MVNNTLKNKLLISYFSIILLFVVLINISTYFILQNFYIESRKKDMILAQRMAINYIDTNNYKVDVERIKQIQSEVYSKAVIVVKGRIVFDDLNLNYPLNNYYKSFLYSKKLKIGQNKYYVISYPILENEKYVGNVVFFYPMEWMLTKIILIQKQIIFISILALIVVFLYGLNISKCIVTPLNKVVEAIEDVKDGNFGRKIDIKGYKEIQKLCDAFNSMNERILILDKKRRQFVADASHELKSPLAGMKVLIESLMSGGIEDKNIREEFLKSINSEIDRLSNIVNGLLELAKIENSEDLATTRMDLKLLIEDVIKSLKPIAKTKNISIDLKGNSIDFDVNRDNMFRAFYNIIENAIKYSNENSKVDVIIERNKFVNVIIKDYGMGIPEEDMPYIFDRFYRVDKTRARHTGGSGLGLSIAKHIIKLHKGEIEVKSKVGEGTAFIIKLPT